MAELVVDWCSMKAARYAVTRWHYSRRMPSAQNTIGVWENQQFVGAVVFGIGAGNSTNGKRYGLKRKGEVAELVRVALGNHESPTTQIVARAIRLVKHRNPDLRMLISFADEYGQGHLGIIYQAGNWIYAGPFTGDGGFIIHGNVVHSRTVGSRGWKQSVAWLRANVDPKCRKAKTVKHRYLMPLDKAMRRKLESFRQPYPRPVGDEGGHA